MGWSDLMQDSLRAIKDVLNDASDKQAVEKERHKSVVREGEKAGSEEEFYKNTDNAARGTKFMVEEESTPVVPKTYGDLYEFPISYEDYVQIAPYEPLFNKILDEYDKEEDPAKRMALMEDYAQTTPLGKLPFVPMLLDDLYQVDKYYVDNPNQQRAHRQNSATTRSIFNGQMSKFFRNV